MKKLITKARESGINLKDNKLRPRGLPWSAPDVADDELVDGDVAKTGLQLIRRHQDEPFFLAVGFVNPHLPFVAPKKYWDLYDPDTIELADNPKPPSDSPSYAWTNWGELRKYHGMPKNGPLAESQAREAIHGYWAATSYVDASVGLLLDELDDLGLRDKTVVILWGDHGWQLGEHGFWCKHTNYEVAARVPLILSVPGQEKVGVKSDRLVEFVDIFPTLADACDLPAPDKVDGISFMPLLSEPGRAWKKAAFHVYPRQMGNKGKGLGRAIRTERYRLVEWKAAKGDFVSYELYDLQEDPGENVNIAARSPDLVRRLAAQLQAGPDHAKP